MFRIITCAVLFFILSLSDYATYATQLGGAPGVGASLIPLANSPNPYYTNINSNNPYFNNPYYNNQHFNQYNRVGGPAVPILAYSSEHSGDGTYAFSFATGDGKQAQENGYLKDAYIDNAGEPQGTQIVQGSFAYVSPEGTPVQVNYVADENGFRPSGVHIPVDGKTSALPLPGIGHGKDKSILDPFYNRYNPYNHQSNYGKYNARHYDPRHPYSSPRYNPLYNYYNQPLDVPNDRIAREYKKPQ